MLPEFDLLQPRSLPEALEMLAAQGEGALPLAGGTNLVVDLRSGRRRPSLLVDISHLDELRAIRREGGMLVVGGGATIAQILDEPLIAEYAPSVREAAQVFANPLVRNRATVGGNLVDGSPAANMPPPLLVLDAEVELSSRDGRRTMPLDDFLRGVRQTARRPDELLTAVRWAIPAPGSATAFYKVGLRKSDAIAVVAVAVLVEQDAAGVCRKARIALGSVAPRVIRAREAESALEGYPLTEERVAEAARLAAAATSPISDIRASAAYRWQVSESLVRRLLLAAREQG